MKRAFTFTIDTGDESVAELLAFLERVPRGFRAWAIRRMLVVALERREELEEILQRVQATLEEARTWGSL